MTILDGNKLADRILDNLKKKIIEKKLNLKLAVVLAGESLASKSFIRKKEEASRKIGIEFNLSFFPLDVSEDDLKKEVKRLAEDASVSSIVIQLPLPKGFNAPDILNMIPPEKDIDVLTDINFDKFERNKLMILPPVVGAVKCFLEEFNIDINNKKVVIVGKGRLVGKPLAVWFKNRNINYSVIDRSTKNISEITKEADIIISGAGSPGIITDKMVKEGVVLIDAGTSSEEGRVKGDIDKNAYHKASFIAPVPNGIGPVAVACLLDNLFKFAIIKAE
ncbi:MAG: bifunctional 5,10-methylenetetrahydrofolate dehydrogenase/5,10-methenyltetrahydrofolate cyclohydrolase [Candidatus Pacebacteria bacterium]|nr:bifunctional 5,10-methylenetetrahydrofolate dehydrogenase/5,10-methenyltetrahydrofolate cyclohydrolase [Candidatus Paceibacterota bacterium]